MSTSPSAQRTFGDDVDVRTTGTFDLPEDLPAKADPALMARDEQHLTAIAESLEQTSPTCPTASRRSARRPAASAPCYPATAAGSPVAAGAESLTTGGSRRLVAHATGTATMALTRPVRTAAEVVRVSSATPPAKEPNAMLELTRLCGHLVPAV